MKTLAVHYCGWGEDWLLGMLAEDSSKLLFEYSPEALRQQLELSPRHLKLRSAAYGDFPEYLQRLPGFVADALPDGWGLLLMDKLFRQRQINRGPLERLAFIGDRAMGALRFAPADDQHLPIADMHLLTLAQESQQLLTGEVTAALLELVVTGGSPQGARPKALVHYDRVSGQVSTLPNSAGSPWLVKFQAQGEHKEVCAIEHLYAHMARLCGLDIPDTQYFDLSPKLAGFGIARFDREGELRVPTHSLAGLLHTDFRVPSVDYTTYLRATRLLARDEREVQKAFARAVFNVIFHNRDDHAKNFAWCLGRDRRWRLAPAFDLTFCEGPRGEHQTDICGEGRKITRWHLLNLAQQGGVDKQFAQAVVDHITDQAGLFKTIAADFPIRKNTLQEIAKLIEVNRLMAANE